MLKVDFIADGSYLGSLDIGRVKDRIQQDIKTAHGILGWCHSDAVKYSLSSDEYGINFSGKIICSCNKDLALFSGNTNDFHISYTEAQRS